VCWRYSTLLTSFKIVSYYETQFKKSVFKCSALQRVDTPEPPVSGLRMEEVWEGRREAEGGSGGQKCGPYFHTGAFVFHFNHLNLVFFICLFLFKLKNH